MSQTPISNEPDPGPRRWRGWYAAFSRRRLVSGVAVVAALTVLVKLAAMGKEALVAHQFGATAPLDAYVLAMQVVAYLLNTLASVTTAAFVPAYVRARHERGGDEAARLLANVVFLVIGIGLGLTLLLTAGAGLLRDTFGSHLAPEAYNQLRTMFWILAIVPLVGNISYLWGSTLNVHDRFHIPAAAPLAMPLLTALALVLLANRWGVSALAIGTTCGFVGELTILGIGLRRQGVPLTPRWTGWSEPLRQVLAQCPPLLVAGALVCANPLIDQTVAAMLGTAGSVSALNYANKVPAALQGVLMVSVGAVMLPHFSGEVARRDWGGVRRTLRRWSLWLLALTIPGTLAVVALSHPLVRLLYERGKFTAENTQLVTQVQRCYLLQVPFYVVGLLGVRLLHALQGNRIVAAIGLVNLVVNIAGDIVFFHLFGLPGIALSTALVYLIAMVLTFAAIHVRLRSLERGD